eukprot:CAMPEP_0184983138 /NCGR_PEP_ID=MMETSP1098-20130426/12470_1 /TAXON_ID=89044 /ORGANISM="Spumella elongata, Strain CCAP 955/1" /LENGTH=502 /DNA_ID=CAMNT_0027506943 /DNA_START=56 /DNA_END=1564 /DNA_ORIENTATION=+
MASFLATATTFNWQVGLETDIGGGRENQDDCFVWIKRDDNIIVLCVLDGHGREVGKIASESAKACLFKHLDENYRSLIESPAEFLVNAHGIAHEHIRNSFRAELKRQGFDVITTADGYLMKRKQATDNWSCVHGGTSCSIVALINHDLYIANVGDSTGILCSSFGVLAASDLLYVRDAAVPEEKSRGTLAKNQTHQAVEEAGTSAPGSPIRPAGAAAVHSDTGAVAPETALTAPATTENRNNTLVITAEHSPECPYEYERLLSFRAREGSPTVPALVVVYDSNSSDKTRCAPCFERDSAGKPCVTNKGSYYKNVRKEWASLVSTPPYAQFQDALAFTRSLGDLHLHTYGVTHLPEVQRLDMNAAFQQLHTLRAVKKQQAVASSSSANAATTGESDPATGTAKNETAESGSGLTAEEVADSTLCLVLATDGVWDNWLYEDVNKFVMDASCLGAVGAAADGAKRVTISFMQRNALYAKRNFGSNADNATGIVLYISQDPRMPSL